jgi:3-deoxy-D-manno-octulosonic-acid transferase
MDGTTTRMIEARTSNWKQTAGRSLAKLIRAVQRTSTIVMEPADLKDQLRRHHPIILATWHGQFMMTVCLHPGDITVAAMVARHGDAELIGQAMEAFDVELIRGAGAGARKKDRGGAHALRAALIALKGSPDKPAASLVMTADVPPGPARRAGEGIITIARLSGCPILPVASATTRYKAFKTWSRVTINLPFSTLAFVGAPPIHVPHDADAETLELLREQLEASLNTVTARAYALAGADPGRATPPNPASAAVKPGVLLKVYTTGASAARSIVGPLLRHRVGLGKEDAARLGERRGYAGAKRPPGPLVWVHAASVGETTAVLPVIAGLLDARPDISVLLTTTTLTSANLAASRLPPRTLHQFMPLDAPQYAARFLDHWQPNLAIFTESEIWPSLILATADRRIPLALVNGRMSPKSHQSWQRVSSVSAPLFSRFSLILTQNEKLSRWFRDVGGRVVIPVGNLKADAPPPPVDESQRADLQQALEGRPRWLAASTHDGEEAIIAAAHRDIALSVPGVCTLIAPRHPERASALATEFTAKGLRVSLRSRGELPSADTDIYLADTIGELGTLFACTPIAFVGGSLVERGGQNPLEPVSHGSVVLTGPSTHNFRDEYSALSSAGASITVRTAADIADTVIALLAEPAKCVSMTQAAQNAANALKGALPRTLAHLLPLLPPAAVAPSCDTLDLAQPISFKNAS